MARPYSGDLPGYLSAIVEERDAAVAAGDISSLERVRHEQNSLLLTGRLTRRQRVLLTNQIAVCDIKLSELGRPEKLRESALRIYGIISSSYSDTKREELLSNLLYLSALLCTRCGDSSVGRESFSYLRHRDRDIAPYHLIENALSCAKSIIEQDPPDATEWLERAVDFIPANLVGQVISEDNVGVFLNAAWVLSQLGQVTGDSNYIRFSKTLTDKLLVYGNLEPSTKRLVQVNHAQDILKGLELAQFSTESVTQQIQTALDLAESACAISQALRITGESRATDLESLAASRFVAATMDHDAPDLPLLKAALDAADESLTQSVRGSHAWARHASVKVRILSDLARVDLEVWSHDLRVLCEQILDQGHAAPDAFFHYGSLLVRQPSDLKELIDGFWHMLRGARAYTSAPARVSSLADILEQLSQLKQDSLGDWLADYIPELILALLSDYRGTLWSRLGRGYTRSMAASLSWLGSVWAEMSLIGEKDWRSALSALAIVANGLWVMDTDLHNLAEEARKTSSGDPYREFRKVLESGLAQRRPSSYSSSGVGPTLIVLVPGVESGWALVRSTKSECEIVALPGLTREASLHANEALNEHLDKESLRRGHGAPPLRTVVQWLEVTIDLPLKRAGIDVGEWIVWCPTGSAIGLPVHSVTLGHNPRHSYVTDPLFTPNSLRKHEPQRKMPRGAFLGWSKYRTPWLPLPGVLREAKAFEGRVNGDIYVDRAMEKGMINGADLLHIACHGHGGDDRADATLIMGPEGLPIASVADRYGGARDLVLLNACLTASPVRALSDDNLTLAKAFQVAGARSIIGSLWSVSDGDPNAQESLPEVLIRSIYGTLLAGPEYCVCEECVARALSRFVRDLHDFNADWEDRMNWVHIVG